MPEEEKIKTVRLLFTDKGKDIPVTLYDGFLKENVQLNPDGIVSEQFAEELVRSFTCYKIITKGEKVDKKDYKIREDYKVTELKDNFDKLTPEEREQVVDFAQELIDAREAQAEKNSQTQVASEVEKPETVAELKAKADELEIEYPANILKADLIALIEAKEKELLADGKTDNSTENKIPD